MQLFHLCKDQYSQDHYLICLKKKYSWDSFRKLTLVVPSTYSDNFAKRLYSSVFEMADDLNQEYRKYYKNEYKDIYQFMFWRYGVSEKICKQISSATNGYLAVFVAEWQLEDDDLLKKTFIEVFRELDK